MSLFDPSVSLTDDELEAVTHIVGQHIEPYSCDEGTTMRTAYLAWRKLAIANGTLDPEEG